VTRMGKTISANLDDHGLDRVGVYASVSYDPKNEDAPRWAQIGVGLQQADGSLELDLWCIPSNLKRLQIRSMDVTDTIESARQRDSAEALVSREHFDGFARDDYKGKWRRQHPR